MRTVRDEGGCSRISFIFSASIVSRRRERFLHKCVCFNVPGAYGPGVPLCTLVPRDVQFKKKRVSCSRALPSAQFLPSRFLLSCSLPSHPLPSRPPNLRSLPLSSLPSLLGTGMGARSSGGRGPRQYREAGRGEASQERQGQGGTWA